MERMKTPGSVKWSARRMRSPSTAPRVKGLVGSTLTTATRLPRARSSRTRAPMSVLLPTPGAPVMPTRQARPVDGWRSAARRRPSGPRRSTRLIARPSGRRSPAQHPGDQLVVRHPASASASAAAASRRAFSCGHPDGDPEGARRSEGAGRPHDDAAGEEGRVDGLRALGRPQVDQQEVGRAGHRVQAQGPQARRHQRRARRRSARCARAGGRRRRRGWRGPPPAPAR